MSHKPSQKTLVAVEWFREHGGSLRACAQQFDIDVGALRRALSTLHPFMTLPPPGAPRGRRRRKPDGRVPRAAAKMYLEAGGALSMREVGDKFSISKQEVSNAVQHAKRRPRWKALEAAQRTLEPPARVEQGKPTAHLDAARRAAMLWMLVEGSGTQLAVARAAGMTRQWVNQQVAEYEAIIERRQRRAEGWQEPWAKRLRAAGAIP